MDNLLRSLLSFLEVRIVIVLLGFDGNLASTCSEALTDEILRPLFSKREYLMAQIRQKDAIIESLLKQV